MVIFSVIAEIKFFFNLIKQLGMEGACRDVKYIIVLTLGERVRDFTEVIVV